MKSPLAALFVSLLVPLVCAQAAPKAGRYSGILKVTKHVDGLIAIATAKAVANVGPAGELTIVLATAQSPFPDLTGHIPIPGPGDVLRTTIKSDNTCIIPGKPQPAIAPPPEASGAIVSVQLPSRIEPVFSGAIRLHGNSFRLTYTDVPTNDASLIGLTTFTEFTYSFHRISQ